MDEGRLSVRTMRDSAASEAGIASDQAAPLKEGHRHLHRALIDAVLATGAIPTVPELTDRLGTTAEAIRAGLAALATADYLAFDDAGRVVCLYPFSVAPTSHIVVIDGQRRDAMCAIDALGIPSMLGRELAVEGRCAVCDAPIALRVRPGAVVAAAPITAMVVARRDETEPAFAACCPFTVFVCGQKHAGEFAMRIAGAHVLSLADALTQAENIFGDFLAGALPATRPRGKHWEHWEHSHDG